MNTENVPTENGAAGFPLETIVMQNVLAEKHTGMMISCSGLLGRISDGCKVRPDQRYILGELYKHLKEMAERFYSGDIKAVDEFLQLYSLDDKRPKI